MSFEIFDYLIYRCSLWTFEAEIFWSNNAKIYLICLKVHRRDFIFFNIMNENAILDACAAVQKTRPHNPNSAK